MNRYSLLFLFAAATLSAQEFTKAIEDNSFFIEEAYNQEDRVVQHIITATDRNNGAPYDMIALNFTQEWPVWGRAHQLSYSVPYLYFSGFTKFDGVGDVMLNYRYQAIDDPKRAFAPRLSVIIPTGNASKGFGTGSAGLQMNLPYSERISDEFVAHLNLGGTYTPNGVSVGTGKEDYSDIFVGGSAIYLVDSHFNVMLEVLHTNSGYSGNRSDETIVSPGVRCAIDIGGLQIVPGMAFPRSLSQHRSSDNMFFYLSFEHPY